ncbi:MAG: hypothetical protein H6807_18090, partial [Planctomycetes bacterium]|nr:hypothetical protein [Planctomycetota bacterium]
EFAITVVPPHEGSPVGDWLPVEMLSGYSFDPSLEGYSASPDDGAMALVAESYEGAFRTGVLGFDGKVKTLRLQGRWFSGIEGANLVRVEMVPVGGFKKMPAVFADLHWDGSAFDLAIPLPPAVGLYQVEIRVGYRQGLLELDRVAIE